MRAHLGRILSAVEPDIYEQRNAIAIILALNCGLRASELLGLRLRDFNPNLHCIRVLSVKGSRERELPISSVVSGRLKKYVLRAHKCEKWTELIDLERPIFEISYHRLNQVWDQYRPNPNKTLHCLRHTFAVNLFSTTRDVRLVQNALGHKSINNTLVYLDFVYSQNTLRGLMLEASRNHRKGKIQDEAQFDDGGAFRPAAYPRRGL